RRSRPSMHGTAKSSPTSRTPSASRVIAAIGSARHRPPASVDHVVMGGLDHRDRHLGPHHAARSPFEREARPGMVSGDERDVDHAPVQRTARIGHEEMAGYRAWLAATFYDVTCAPQLRYRSCR